MVHEDDVLIAADMVMGLYWVLGTLTGHQTDFFSGWLNLFSSFKSNKTSLGVEEAAAGTEDAWQISHCWYCLLHLSGDVMILNSDGMFDVGCFVKTFESFAKFCRNVSCKTSRLLSVGQDEVDRRHLHRIAWAPVENWWKLTVIEGLSNGVVVLDNLCMSYQNVDFQLFADLSFHWFYATMSQALFHPLWVRIKLTEKTTL